MMNQFGLIIQETTAGSGQQFVSAHLDVDNPEIKETITDERFIATQLANLTDVYTVQITKNYKVYSLIVTDLGDFLGRSGYYAIRLYGPKGVNLTNFEIILDDIKKEYNKYTNSNNVTNQNYDGILSSILIIENERKNFISQKSDVNCYYYFEETNTTLSTLFNTKGINLVHKVYAFNKGRAVSENSAESLGLKPYTSINSTQKEINIINSHSLLKELKINNQTIDFNPNLSDFNLICQSSDVVVFNSTDEKNFRQIDDTFISIERKFIPRAEPRPNPNNGKGGKKKTANQETAIYITILILTVLLGGGLMFYDNIYKIINPEPIINTFPIEEDTIPANDKEKIVFEIDGQVADSIYKTNYPKLEKYRFIFDKGKWQYKKDNESNIDFYVEHIKKIIENNKLSIKEDDFKNKLEEKSGHTIENKEIIQEEVKNTERPTSSKPVHSLPQDNATKKTVKDTEDQNTQQKIKNTF
jgi:hypothetical protein